MKLSVVIPTHDRVDKLRACLESFARQDASVDVAELVVVNDGSVDGTAAYLSAIAGQPWPFELRAISIPQSGPAAARNRGIEAATGDVVLFTGDDCIAAPGLVAEHLRAHRDLGVATSVLGHTTWLPSLEITPFMHYQENGGSQFAYWRIEDTEDAGAHSYYTTNVSTPRNTLAIHRFDERFPAARFEDMELGYRLARAGHRVVYRRAAEIWHDHPIRFDTFRRASVGYGHHAVCFHRLHIHDEQLERAIGVRGARSTRRVFGPALCAAERSIEQLESAMPIFDPAADSFGEHGAMAMLAQSYRLLIHFALITGIREALALPPLEISDDATARQTTLHASPQPRGAGTPVASRPL